MLVVSVKLRPFGDPQRERELATVEIRNDGTGTAEVGNYTWRAVEGAWVREGRIANWPRQDRTSLDLLAAVLNQLTEKP